MIERHSKVFVPVFGKDADHIFTDDKFQFPVKEKENVYVLTEQEFDFMQSYLSRLQAMLESGETYSFDNEYDFKDSIEIKEFFQSKTNPQTENK